MKAETRVGLFIVAGMTILLYLSIHIGEIRLNRDEYESYLAYFDDTGGLEIKSPVKVAGVTVGWVEKIRLLRGGKAEIELKVNHSHRLGKNAFVRISQEGLIGKKTIEIDPGDSSSGYLQPGSTLAMPGRSPTTVSDLLEQFRDISSNVNEVSYSVRNLVASQEGEERLNSTLDNVHEASENIAQLSGRLDSTLDRNQENLEQSIENIRDTSQTLRDDLPGITTHTRETLGSIDDAAIQAKDMFKEADEVMEKVNSGKGLIGKLINDDDMHSDLSKAVKGFKNFINKTQNLSVTLDGHSETMLDKSDSKGYAGLSFYTYSDYFYHVELVSGVIGRFEKETILNRYYDSVGKEIKLPTVDEAASLPGINEYTMAAYASKVEQTRHSQSKTLLSVQIGKRFNNLTFRGGLFEDTFGVGVDYEIPTNTERFRWTTSLEVYDLYGHNRVSGEHRAHIKWLNRVFFIRNIYTAFGIDDAIASEGSAPFWGFGLTFDDDDLKYVISNFLGMARR